MSCPVYAEPAMLAKPAVPADLPRAVLRAPLLRIPFTGMINRPDPLVNIEVFA